MTQLRDALATLESARLTATPLFVRVKLHESAMGLVAEDYALTERAGKEAILAASKIIGPRSMEVATAMQLISKSYLFMHREAEAVTQSKQALDLMLSNYNGDYSHPRVFESAQYHANALIHVGELDTAAAMMQDVLARAIKGLGAESRMVGEIYAHAVPSELERGNLPVAIDLARKVHRHLPAGCGGGLVDPRVPGPPARTLPGGRARRNGGGEQRRGGRAHFGRLERQIRRQRDARPWASRSCTKENFRRARLKFARC